MENKKIKVTLVRSLIGATEKQIRTVKALGLKKKDSTVEHYATPEIKGMINAIPHMLKVSE